MISWRGKGGARSARHSSGGVLAGDTQPHPKRAEEPRDGSNACLAVLGERLPQPLAHHPYLFRQIAHSAVPDKDPERGANQTPPAPMA